MVPCPALIFPTRKYVRWVRWPKSCHAYTSPTILYLLLFGYVRIEDKIGDVTILIVIAKGPFGKA
jgi:hypothetical protein